MSAEEALKDGKLTQAQVEQRVRLVNAGSWALTLVGVTLFMVSLFCGGR